MASTDVIQQPPSIPDTTVPVNTGTAQQPYIAITEPEAVTPTEIVPPPPAEGIPAGKTGITPPGGGGGNTTYTTEVKRGTGRKTAKRALAFSEFRKETERNQHTGVAYMQPK